MKNILRKLAHACGSLLYRLFWIFPIKSNRIFITGYYGKGYGDSGKYIVDELLCQNEEYDIVWSLRNTDEELPTGVRGVKFRSVKAIYNEATSRIWIDNCRKMPWTRKRRGQYYIQIWHGDIGLKKIEKDAEAALADYYVESAKNDSAMADLFVSGNEWFSQCIKRAFWYDGEIAECGYPRRDILYSTDEKLKSDIRRALGINREEKILFYAPTFRRAMSENDLSVYKIDWQRVLAAMSERFGGEWVGMVRLHPNISKYADLLNLPENVFNATDYPDMQELLFAADACVTDYSSSVFDFAVTQKPGFIFAVDYEEYKKDRDTYFDVKKLPFPFAESNDELVADIIGFDLNEYLKKHDEFYNGMIGMYEEGHASEYIAEIIKSKCFKSNDRGL